MVRHLPRKFVPGPLSASVAHAFPSERAVLVHQHSEPRLRITRVIHRVSYRRHIAWRVVEGEGTQQVTCVRSCERPMTTTPENDQKMGEGKKKGKEGFFFKGFVYIL